MYEATLGGVFRLYRAALPRCWIPSLVLAAGMALVGLAMNAAFVHAVPATDDLYQMVAQTRAFMVSAGFWRWLLISGVISTLCYGALVAVIHAVAVPDTPVPTAAGFGPALRSLPAALVAGVVFGVVTTLGTIALFVPGAYLWGMWQLWLVALVVERLGPIDSLRRSWHLMVGAWWRITTLITLVFVVIFALLLAAYLAYMIAGGVLLMLGADLQRASVAATIMEAVCNLLLSPLVAAAFVASYLDRVRARVAGA
jgi:hypothetical protein